MIQFFPMRVLPARQLNGCIIVPSPISTWSPISVWWGFFMTMRSLTLRRASAARSALISSMYDCICSPCSLCSVLDITVFSENRNVKQPQRMYHEYCNRTSGALQCSCMKAYDHKKIEETWRRKWLKQELYKAADDNRTPRFAKGFGEARKKFYHLVMFAYPSGDLHIGHWYNFAPADVLARKKRMEGYDVLSPFGFDAFGLPAENAAIKQRLHPKEWTYGNLGRMRGQLQSMGPSYDWSREIITSDPEYYKWTQWMFLQLYKKGLAYRADVPANWCPSCKTVLANEQVVDGACERCKTGVVQKRIAQWMFKITAYADELLSDLDSLDWPERTKIMQRNWIGRSEGAMIKFKTAGKNPALDEVGVFTTRPDKIFGDTYLVLAPEKITDMPNCESRITNYKDVKKYIEEAAKKTEIERTSTEREKTGVELKGIKAVNPATKEEIPVWISDYVLAHYGAGAIMAVPAHDERDYEFAKKFSLPVQWVICGKSPAMDDVDAKAWQELIGDHAYAGNGWMVDSGKFSGMESEKA